MLGFFPKQLSAVGVLAAILPSCQDLPELVPGALPRSHRGAVLSGSHEQPYLVPSTWYQNREYLVKTESFVF